MALSARSRARARTTNIWTGLRSSAAVVDGGGAALVQLIGLQNQGLWLDTVTEGGVLDTIIDFPVGGSATATIATQIADVQPAANALVVVGNQIRAGAGWAAVRVGPLRLTVELTQGAVTKTAVRYVEKLSDRPASFPVVTNDAQMVSAVAAANAAIAAGAASFDALPGYVIEVSPSASITDAAFNFALNSRTQQVVIRSSDLDRRFGAKPRFNRTVGTNLNRTLFQNIEFVNTNWGNGTDAFLLNGSGAFVHTLGCRYLGGQLEWNGSATVQNPDSRIDATDAYRLWGSHLQAALVSGGYPVVNLRNVITNTTETGAALGVWKVAANPVFVGQGCPGGTAGIKLNCMVSVNGSGSGLDGDIEFAFLTSTPINILSTGALVAKPAGGPDGIYLVAWKVNAAGTGYTAAASEALFQSVRWTNQWTYGYAAGGIVTTGNYTSFASNRCEYVDVNNGCRISVSSVTDEQWRIGNVFRNIWKDANVFSVTASIVMTRAGAIKYQFNHHHKRTGMLGWFLVPHSDDLQIYPSPNSLANCIIRVESVGNISYPGYPGGAGSSIAQPQGHFQIDAVANTSGHRVFSGWNYWGTGQANGLSVDKVDALYSLADYVRNKFGAGGTKAVNNRMYQDKGFFIGDKTLFGSFPGQAAPAAYQDLKDRTSVSYVAATLDYLPTIAEVRSAFTVQAPNADYGPFRSPLQECDHVRQVFDPNSIPARLVFRAIVNADPGAAVVTDSKDLWVGTKARTITPDAGVGWASGATEALADANGTFSTSPGSLPLDHWARLQITAPAGFAEVLKKGITIDGVRSDVTITTKDSSTAGVTTDGAARLIQQSATPSSLGGTRKVRIAGSFFLPAGGGSGILAWRDSNTFIQLVSNGDFVIRYQASSVISATTGFATILNGENRFVIDIDLTKESPFTDDGADPPFTDNHANNSIIVYNNGVRRIPYAGIGQIDTTPVGGVGTRALEFLAGTWRLMGSNAAFCTSGLKMNWFGISAVNAATDLPALSDPNVLKLFSNANIGANGENWPGQAPQLFVRGAATYYVPGPGANMGSAGASIPGFIKEGAGTLT